MQSTEVRLPDCEPSESLSSAKNPSRRSAVLSAAIFAACILISYPVSNVPWGDDFSYSKTALEFARTGHIVYNGWATAVVGWQILWGALFIRIFGFSFTVLQLSIIPISIATIYLFHRILERFGMTPGEAMLGSLTLGLTPLFMDMASSFLTDIPGLFGILLCVWMCQRAAAAEDTRTALKWTILAAVTNIIAGTVRQTTWLGALVMVPSTAWILRRWRGMIPTAAVLWLLSLASVFGCIHWFNRQPYAVPEPFVLSITLHSAKHITIYAARTILCLLLLIFPLTVAWLPSAARLNKRGRNVGITCVSLLIVVVLILAYRGTLNSWMTPWLIPFLDRDMKLVPVWIKWALSAIVTLTSILVVAQIAFLGCGVFAKNSRRAKQGAEIFWILGPFTLAYVGLLAPRAATALIQDRYLLVLVPPVIIFLLFAYRTWFAPVISPISIAVVVVYGLCAVAWSHDNFANARAMKTTIDRMFANGEGATSIQAGLGLDGWTQIQYHGYINEQRMRNPPGAYSPNVPDWGLSQECNYWISLYTPVIRPKYFISEFPRNCPGSSIRLGAAYDAWMPPFHRVVKVQELPIRNR